MKNITGKVNILLAEDNDQMRMLLQRHIQNLDYNVTAVHSGKEVKDIVVEQKFDLLLLDYHLPDMDAGRLIKEVKKEAELPPFIVITASGDEKVAVSMMKAEANNYWVKDGAFLDTVEERVKIEVNKIKNLHKLEESRRKIKIIEQQSRKVLESMANPVVVINKEKKIVFHNKAFHDVFGLFDRQEPCYRVLFNRKTICPWCVDISENNKDFINLQKLLEKNGCFYQPALGPIALNGNRHYVLGIFHNVTDSVLARRRAEKNEAILRNLIATAREAIVGINNKGRIVLHNKAALQLFEVKSGSLQRKTFFSLFAEDKYCLRLKRLFARVTEGKQTFLTEKSFRLTVEIPDSGEKIIETNLSVNEINGDKLYLFIMRDITEQYRMKKNLLEQKMFIRSLIDNLPDHIYFKDTKLRFILSNEAHNQHLGVSSEKELFGKTDRDYYSARLAKKYQEDEMKVIRSRKPTFNKKEMTINKKGEKRWNLTSKIPILDGYGRVKGIVGIGRDITELEMKDRELRKSRRRLEGLLEISLGESLNIDTILDLALEKCIELTESEIGYIYFYNESTRVFTLHNWSKTVTEQCSIADKRKVTSLDSAGLWGETVRQRKPVLVNNYNEDIPHKRGLPKGHVPLSRFLSIPVFSQGEIVAVAGVANKKQPYEKADLIQLELLMDSVWRIIVQKQQKKELIRAKEKAEESDRLKTVFLSTMSHELRTPLNAILGFSHLLEKTSELEEVREYASYISEGGERLLSIIENIFFVSTIEGGQLKIEKGGINPVQLIKEVISSFRQRGIPDNIEILTDFPLETETTKIATDRRKTEEILRILLDNALKFTPNGQITVGCKTGKGKIRYFVKDTGIGIPEDKKEVIFEKFRQLDERTTREYGGIGIGLYLAKRLTDILNGTIWVEDNHPEGSIFYVEVPVDVLGEFEEKSGKGKEKTIDKTTGKTVLIAEDNPVSAMLLKKLMQEMGMEPVYAENGLEAVKYVKENRPDLILMDLNMPVMDGFEAIKKIKKIRDDIPIIIQTAYDSEEGRAKAYELNVRDFVSKPVKRDELVEKVKRLVYS